MSDTCPTCGSRVTVVQGDEGTAHYEPTDGHLAREWKQRWEGENVLRESSQARLREVEERLGQFRNYKIAHKASCARVRNLGDFVKACSCGRDSLFSSLFSDTPSEETP